MIFRYTHKAGRRRGLVLVLALAAISAMPGLLTVLMLNGADRYRMHRIDKLRQSAIALADSAAAWVTIHAPELQHNEDAVQPVDVTDLLPPHASGSVTVSRLDSEPARLVIIATVQAGTATGRCERLVTIQPATQ